MCRVGLGWVCSLGKKMGKTAAGAVWLNRDLLSEYDYWQFWRNTADADTIRFLKVHYMHHLLHMKAHHGVDIIVYLVS